MKRSASSSVHLQYHEWWFISRRKLRQAPTDRYSAQSVRFGSRVQSEERAKRHLRNGRRNSILMTCNFLDLGSASDWLKQISLGARPFRSTTQSLEVAAIWRALVPQYVYSPFFSPSLLKYMNQLLAWQGTTSKKKKRKRNCRQPGRLGASFRSVLKSTMITWGTREL